MLLTSAPILALALTAAPAAAAPPPGGGAAQPTLVLGHGVRSHIGGPVTLGP